MDKQKIQEAINRVDSAVSQLTVNRQVHVALANDVQLIQKCCMQQFEEKKDGGTNKQSKRPKSRNKDSEGSGDSV